MVTDDVKENGRTKREGNRIFRFSFLIFYYRQDAKGITRGSHGLVRLWRIERTLCPEVSPASSCLTREKLNIFRKSSPFFNFMLYNYRAKGNRYIDQWE